MLDEERTRWQQSAREQINITHRVAGERDAALAEVKRLRHDYERVNSRAFEHRAELEERNLRAILATPEGRAALKALLTESQVVGAVILAASNPVFDDGHTDNYYEGLLAAAVAALDSPEEDT